MYKLCVVGNPISHSKSPWIHGQFSRETGIKIQYEKIAPPLAQFKEAILQFKENGGRGLNITRPFKQEAFQLANHFTPRATVAKAANTYLFNADGSITADNTDGVGFVKDITQNLQFNIKNKKVLLLGSGGAMRGILQPLLQEVPEKVVIINRTQSKAIDLVTEFSKWGNLGWLENLSNLEFDLVIDGTGGESIPSTRLKLAKASLCYDLKYSDTPTVFMQWGKQQGAHQCVEGMGMLVEQAAESFYFWTGIRPDTKNVLQSFTRIIL